MLNADVLEDGKRIEVEAGTPQDGSASVRPRLRGARCRNFRSVESLKALNPEFLHCERAISLVIPTEPSASGRRGTNAERFAWTAEKKESLRVDPSAAPHRTVESLKAVNLDRLNGYSLLEFALAQPTCRSAISR